MFERLPSVPRSQELIDRAFRRSTRTGQGDDVTMIRSSSSILSDNLANLVRKFPSFESLPPFYRDLVDILVGVDKMRISLSRVGWASRQIRDIASISLSRMKAAPDRGAVRRAAFGRMASVLKSVEADLLFLGESRDRLRKLPTINPDLPTIIVAGYPNVGKSSFIASVTNARPEVASYPFTTHGISVGHLSSNDSIVQVVDTPGLLDRPLSQKNEIERQAVTALRHLRGVVLFITDPSGHCGFPLSDQFNLLQDIKGWIDMPILVAANKADLTKEQPDLSMSTMTGEGVPEVLNRLLEMLGTSKKVDIRCP